LNGLIAPRSTDGSDSKPFDHGQMAGFDKSGRLRADDEMARSGSISAMLAENDQCQLSRSAVLKAVRRESTNSRHSQTHRNGYQMPDFDH
jgi:hypothetical protein